MKKAFTGHAGALCFTKKATAVLALLLLTTSVVSCNTPADDGASTDTSAVTEDSGMKGGDVFVMDGHLSEVVYPLKGNMVTYAGTLMQSIYDNYLSSGNHQIAVSIVPDKNVYLSASDAYTAGTLTEVPVIDYAEMTALLRAETDDFAQFIDLTNALSLSSYYYTDMHWRQELLAAPAHLLGEAFGLDIFTEGEGIAFSAHPFVGSYTKDALADTAETDTLYYLMNETLEQVHVTDYEGGVPQDGVLYNTEIDADQKTYDLFLSGPMPLQVIESPLAKTDRELIIFRDSFGSAIAPYFCDQYAKVTLVDLRYLNSGVLGDFIEFESQDILFLYSTHILNTAMILK